MVESDFEKIIKKFGFDELYSKQQIMDGLKKIGIIENEKGLLNKIKGEISFRKVYQHGHTELKIMYINSRKLYRIVTWGK